MSLDGMSNPSFSKLWWEDGNKGWSRRGEDGSGWQGRAGGARPQFGTGKTWVPKSDNTVIQTGFMCSAAARGRVEAGDREVF